MSEKLITIKQAAEHLHLCERTIYRMVSQQEIPFVRLGSALRFSISSLDMWVQSQMKMPAEEPVKTPPAPPARRRPPVADRRTMRGPGLAARTEWPEGYVPIHPVE